jgi:hypothetical protein
VADGISQGPCGTNCKTPLQTIGQGNSCGPAGWAVSTPTINMMKMARFGFLILTALSVTCVTFVCYTFVDNTADVVHSARDIHTTGTEVLHEMQAVVDHWEGGLRATGGAVVQEKSY